MATNRIPFLDLQAQHAPIRAELLDAFEQVLTTSAFAGGPFVQKFESDFAGFCRARHCVGVGNGTDAIWLALLGLGVGPGDEVITVSATFMATAEAISYCGAKPVFVDIDETTYTIDPRAVERAITPRTKAIIPVHLYGHVADMDPIMALARRHALYVIEDACQAHGADYKGRRAGTIGDAGCFSFYPGKNLGAVGEAGAVVTNDTALANEIRVLRDHGQATKYHHARIGWNARMDGIQGAVLAIKLRQLDEGNLLRRLNAETYARELAGTEGIILPIQRPDCTHVFHLFVIRVANRDEVLAQLGQRGIGCGIHYPKPVHLQAAYASLGMSPGSLPVTERWAEEVLSLPMFPQLTSEQVRYVAQELKSVLTARRTAVEVATA